MGLSVTEDRIKLIAHLNPLKSGITIEDKTNVAGEPEGTRIIITINTSHTDK